MAIKKSILPDLKAPDRGAVSDAQQARRMLDSAVKGGLIDANLSLRSVADRIGPEIQNLRGYCFFWEDWILIPKGGKAIENVLKDQIK